MDDDERYLDKLGRPLDIEGWTRLFADADYRRVSQDELPDGRFLSTIWLGLNHAWFGGPPLIFETMLFAKNGESIEQWRWSTEEEARLQHRRILSEIATKH